MKRLLLRVGPIAVGLAVGITLGWLAIRGVDWGEVLDALRRVSPFWALVALAFFILSAYLRAVRWRLLWVRERVSTLRLLIVENASLGVNNVLPIRASAEAIQFGLLTMRDQLPGGAVIATMMMTRILDLAFTFAFILLIVAFLPVPLPATPIIIGALVFLGALYRGAVPVPADMGAGEDFVSSIARETEARALFHTRLRSPPDVGARAYVIENLDYDIASLQPQQSPASLSLDDIAQILYTSGTTGTPKGVVLTHRNIAANLRSIAEAIEISADHFFIAGGAPLDVDLERFWHRLGFLVLQGYGLTEAAPVVTADRLDARKTGSVGLPLPGVAVAIADDGEVLVRGENVSPGYFKDPEKTAETFKDGWLHTGDLGYMDEDGFLFIRGRKKDMIVTPAGLNVYPEDVEGVLRKTPGVRDAVVLEFQGRVHAVLLLDEGADASEVIESANAGLAEHQRVRGHTVWPGEDFPRTTTRKPKKHDILAALERMEEKAAPGERGRVEGAASKVVSIISRVSGKPAGDIAPGDRLSADLGLDSVARIELVMALEEELNTDIAEDAITDETTVQDVERLLEEGVEEQRQMFARWGLSAPAVGARSLFQSLLVFPLYRWFVRQRVEGLEHLKDLDGPVVFAPNHASHLDSVAVLKALPSRMRRRTAIAQFAEFFEAPRHRPDLVVLRKSLFVSLTLGFNIYPLPREHGFRQSLEYTGELLDKGWNILIYPEGELTRTGEIQHFREGIGVIAGEMRVPVVAIYIRGLYEVLPSGRYMPKRGSAVVRIGEPLLFHKESYGQFASRLEAEVRRLSERHEREMAAVSPGRIP